MAEPKGSARVSGEAQRFKQWSKSFLSELAATSNVSAAARKAGISTSTAYEARRDKAEFNRAWQRALCEGYDHLEMELLHRLRSGEVKPATGAKRGVRAFDNATAYRLLLAHRDSAARQRAIRDNEDAEAIILEINAKLEKMRARQIAAKQRALPAPEGSAGSTGDQSDG